MAMLNRRRPVWWLLGLTFGLVLAGCGSSGGAGGDHRGHTGQPAGAQAAAGAEGAHDMGSMTSEPIELPAGRKAPKLTLTATPDPMGGFNLRVGLTNFRLVPQHTNRKPVPGEGHLHLYVDGHKHTRLYGAWFYLDGLTPGAHALRVDAVANNHAPYHHDGNPIFATAAVQAA